jgi:type I restriction enzyme S subunit
MQSGGTPSTSVDEYWSGDIPWITGADFGEMNINQIRRYITEEAVVDSSTKVIPEGDILLVSRTGVGKIAIAPFDVAISQDITGLSVNNHRADTQFLLFSLYWTLPKLARFNQGTSINGVTRSDLKRHHINLPSNEEQRKIAIVLDDQTLQIDYLETYKMQLQQQKKGLMQQLLTGQVRVKVEAKGCKTRKTVLLPLFFGPFNTT